MIKKIFLTITLSLYAFTSIMAKEENLTRTLEVASKLFGLLNNEEVKQVYKDFENNTGINILPLMELEDDGETLMPYFFNLYFQTKIDYNKKPYIIFKAIIIPENGDYFGGKYSIRFDYELSDDLEDKRNVIEQAINEINALIKFVSTNDNFDNFNDGVKGFASALNEEFGNSMLFLAKLPDLVKEVFSEMKMNNNDSISNLNNKIDENKNRFEDERKIINERNNLFSFEGGGTESEPEITGRASDLNDYKELDEDEINEIKSKNKFANYFILYDEIYQFYMNLIKYEELLTKLKKYDNIEEFQKLLSRIIDNAKHDKALIQLFKEKNEKEIKTHIETMIINSL